MYEDQNAQTPAPADSDHTSGPSQLERYQEVADATVQVLRQLRGHSFGEPVDADLTELRLLKAGVSLAVDIDAFLRDEQGLDIANLPDLVKFVLLLGMTGRGGLLLPPAILASEDPKRWSIQSSLNSLLDYCARVLAGDESVIRPFMPIHIHLLNIIQKSALAHSYDESLYCWIMAQELGV